MIGYALLVHPCTERTRTGYVLMIGYCRVYCIAHMVAEPVLYCKD